MPDYTVEYHWVCTAVDSVCAKVKDYTVTYDQIPGRFHCTCLGFKYKKVCKHAKEVAAELCRWNGFWDEGEPTVDEDGVHLCPNCGAPCKSVGFAV